MQVGQLLAGIEGAGATEDPTAQDQLDRLSERDCPGKAEIAEWRRLIEATGAVQRIERMIETRVTVVCASLAGAGLNDFVLAALRDLAVRAANRVR
jgi:hypothetical protein